MHRVSTATAITEAVVEAARTEGTVERVVCAIAPGNDTPWGRALVEAILSRAGTPIADQPRRCVWGSPRRLKLPGLGARWVSACEMDRPAVDRPTGALSRLAHRSMKRRRVSGVGTKQLGRRPNQR